jgi:hypothetical protein
MYSTCEIRAKLRGLVCVALASLFLGGCAKTNLTNLYLDPNFPSAPLDNLLVISVERVEDVRRLWEEAIAAEFQARGILATPSYQLFPMTLPDSQQVRIVLRDNDFDGAVVTHRLATTQGGGHGGYSDSSPMIKQDYWRGWYQSYYKTATMGEPPPPKQPKGRYQLDVWSGLDGGKFVWMGSTVEIDPLSAEKIREEVAGQLVPELARRGIIPND